MAITVHIRKQQLARSSWGTLMTFVIPWMHQLDILGVQQSLFLKGLSTSNLRITRRSVGNGLAASGIAANKAFQQVESLRWAASAVSIAGPKMYIESAQRKRICPWYGK